MDDDIRATMTLYRQTKIRHHVARRHLLAAAVFLTAAAIAALLGWHGSAYVTSAFAAGLLASAGWQAFSSRRYQREAKALAERRTS